MPTIDVTDAAQRLLDNKTVTPGHCLMYVSRAIRNGVQPLIWAGLDTALNCWNLACGDKHDSRSVPKGFPAFLGAKRGNADGDVIISLGDGTFAATDWPGWRQVGICTLEEREAQTGRKYLGYAGEFLGYTLTSTATASLPVTPITEPKEVPEMASRPVIIANENIPGIFHVVSVPEGWQTLDTDELGNAELRGLTKIITAIIHGDVRTDLSGEEINATRGLLSSPAER